MRLRSRSVAASKSARLRRRSAASKGLRQTISRSPAIVGRGDLGQVTIVEQRQLQRAAIRQLLDARRPERGDPVQPGRLEILADARAGDHAAVANHDHTVQAEAELELLHLAAERHRVGGVALEHLDCDRAALTVAQQAIDDLEPVGPMITAVAVLRQCAAAAFEIGGADVVKGERATRQMALGQRVLDPLLLVEQPVERLIDLPFGHLAQAQPLPQAGGRRLRIERPHRRQLGGRRDQPAHDERHHQIASSPAGMTAPALAQQLRQADLLRGAEDGGDVAMGQRAADGQRLFRPGQRHPRNNVRRPSTKCSGQSVRLAIVRFFTLPSAR